MKWKPIIDAPEQKNILLFAYTDNLPAGRNWRMGSGHFRKGYEDEPGVWEGDDLNSWDSTHWMPLPAPESPK